LLHKDVFAIAAALIEHLHLNRAWAEILAALSGAIYVPFESAGLIRSVTWHGFALLAVNLIVVGIMVRALLSRPP
jgi:uncharacterized membrane protein (DUF2068 family)